MPAALTIDLSLGNTHEITLTQSASSVTLNNPVVGQVSTIVFIQNDNGAYTVSSWPANVKWTAGRVPAMSAGTGLHDVVTLAYDGTNFREVSRTPVPRTAAYRQAIRQKAQGFTDQTWDLWGAAAINGQSAPTTTNIYGTMIGLDGGSTISNVWVSVGTLGAGAPPTAIYAAVYSLAGVQLGVSANVNSSSIFTAATQPVPIPLTTAYNAPSDAAVYLCFLENGTWGTTQMQLLHGYQSALVQGHTLSGGSPFSVIQLGQTIMPAPAALVLDSNNYWFGWS